MPPEASPVYEEQPQGEEPQIEQNIPEISQEEQDNSIELGAIKIEKENLQTYVQQQLSELKEDLSDGMNKSEAVSILKGFQNTLFNKENPNPQNAAQAILAIQVGLSFNGLFEGKKLDGEFGAEETRPAVMEFQNKWNDEHPQDQIAVDGIPGVQTIGRIMNSLDGSPVDTTSTSQDTQEVVAQEESAGSSKQGDVIAETTDENTAMLNNLKTALDEGNFDTFFSEANAEVISFIRNNLSTKTESGEYLIDDPVMLQFKEMILAKLSLPKPDLDKDNSDLNIEAKDITVDKGMLGGFAIKVPGDGPKQILPDGDISDMGITGTIGKEKLAGPQDIPQVTEFSKQGDTAETTDENTVMLNDLKKALSQQNFNTFFSEENREIIEFLEKNLGAKTGDGKWLIEGPVIDDFKKMVLSKLQVGNLNLDLKVKDLEISGNTLGSGFVIRIKGFEDKHLESNGDIQNI